MSKIICVDNKGTVTSYNNYGLVKKEITIDLTIGKIYDICEVIYTNPIMYKIKDDRGVVCNYNKQYFEGMDFVRDKLLTDIGI